MPCLVPCRVGRARQSEVSWLPLAVEAAATACVPPIPPQATCPPPAPTRSVCYPPMSVANTHLPTNQLKPKNCYAWCANSLCQLHIAQWTNLPTHFILSYHLEILQPSLDQVLKSRPFVQITFFLQMPLPALVGNKRVHIGGVRYS